MYLLRQKFLCIFNRVGYLAVDMKPKNGVKPAELFSYKYAYCGGR